MYVIGVDEIERVTFVLEEGITHCNVNSERKLTYNYK
jgi:hypothetical protein